jgi:hypothetical protein
LAPRHPAIERFAEATFSTGLNASVFMGVVALGCIYILVAKLAGIDQFFVTFVPVAIMLTYALVIYLARSLRLRDDQSGDNLYYMGFLITLTSLGVSLYQFSATRAAEEIVQNFGIAIASTITGVALRVVFNQMRRDPVEVERMMRLELAEAARRVRRELDSTVVEFAYHRRSAQQAATDSFRDIAEKFDEIVGKFQGTLEDITAKLASPLEAASRQSGDTLGELSKTLATTLGESAQQLGTETDRLAIRVQATAIKLDEIITTLGAIETPESAIKAGLEPLTQALAFAVERLSQPPASAATVKEAVEASSGALAATIDQFRTDSQAHIALLQSMLEKTDQTMTTFTDVLIKSAMEATIQTEGLREALLATEAGAQTLVAAADKIARSVEDARVRRPPLQREHVD